jgi:hypothetical protein
MFPALKKAFLPAVLVALLLGAASQLPASPVQANISGASATESGVWFLDSYGIASAECDASTELRSVRLFSDTDPVNLVNHITEESGVLVGSTRQDPIIQIGANDDIIFCVEPNANNLNVSFVTNGPGTWNDASCGDKDAAIYVERVDDNCIASVGENSGALTVVAAGNGVLTNDTSIIAITFTCNRASIQDLTIDQDDAFSGDGDEITFTIMCKGDPANISLTVSPDRIESSPALGNSSISLIRAEITDAAGLPLLPGTVAEITASSCSLSTDQVDDVTERNYAVNLFAGFKDHPENFFDDVDLLGQAADVEGTSVLATLVEVDTNIPPDGVPNHSEALALLHAEGCEPGPVTITVRVEGATNDVEATATITVVGPIAFITIAASPTTLICGEKSEITVTGTDKLKQQVSDHTFVEVVTNWGGVLGGTGSSLTGGGPVDPISNTTIELLKGSGKAYLLTSDIHIGQYEVLAASTPSFFGRNLENHAPVAAQVTVTCTNGTPTPVTAPNTGTGASTGTIRPPNTGDAGLAAPSSTNATLYVIAAAIAFVTAGLASIRYARR